MTTLATRRAPWRLIALALLLAVALTAPLHAAPLATTVFINEIHYDNVGDDAGEFIEIAGPAGTDLSGWRIVYYNGNDGAVYASTTLSAGTVIPDQINGVGAIDQGGPFNGIQNGAPDGVALVDQGGTVIQFLSYEGTFTAVGGPAGGMTSINIGVSENQDTPVGYSLQLGGNGCTYEAYGWQGPRANTRGAINRGQTIPPNCTLAVTLATFDATLLGDGTTRVRWETVSEVDTLGFHLWRGSDESAPAERITAELIQAQAGGGSQGAAYEWVDESASGTAYFYWLEDIDTSGVSTMHGPTLAQPEAPTAVTLGTMVRSDATLALPLIALGALALAAGLLLRRRA